MNEWDEGGKAGGESPVVRLLLRGIFSASSNRVEKLISKMSVGWTQESRRNWGGPRPPVSSVPLSNSLCPLVSIHAGEDS